MVSCPLKTPVKTFFIPDTSPAFDFVFKFWCCVSHIIGTYFTSTALEFKFSECKAQIKVSPEHVVSRYYIV